MKTTATTNILVNTCVLCLALTTCARATDTFPSTIPTEVLGHDFHDGRTNKIARVLTVTPTHVQVIYEGGKAGRRIPRHELPPELQAKYPYDAAEAEEYRKRQAEIAAQQAAASSAAARATLFRQEEALTAEIARLGKQDAKLQSNIQIYRRMPKGNGRKVQLVHLLNQQQQVREQLSKLEAQLDTLRARRNAIP